MTAASEESETNNVLNFMQKRHCYAKYIVNEWNFNGYHSISKPYNKIFKQTVISNIYADFWILPETHCLKNQLIDLESYTVYQHNRLANNKARRGSGGIAIAIHNTVLETHVVVGVYKGLDGQIGLKLKNTLNDFLLGIFGLYLSPDSYIYGQDPENFLNEASVIWDDLSDCDMRIGSGDLNSRTQTAIDYLPDIDGNLPPRTNPDPKKNSHGGHFITFLKDNRAIILNGRVTPEKNNFTFVSTRGCSVPDYMFCPVNELMYCKEMKTLLIRDLVNSLSIPPPESLPDHSILSGTFMTSSFNFNQAEQSSFEPFNNMQQSKANKEPRKNLRKIDENFFMSQETLILVQNTITRLENADKNQTEINKLWLEIKTLFLNEMASLPNIPSSNCKKMNKKFKKGHKFWNNELANLWSLTCQAERAYTSFKVSQNADLYHKNNLRQTFKNAQSNFDKKFRYFKRQFKNKDLNDLEKLASENSADIWAKLKKLGDPPCSKAALEIVRADETISRDIKEVLERWHLDISRLFSGIRDNPEMAFNEKFYQEIINKKQEFDQMSLEYQQAFSNLNLSSDELNIEITFLEVSKAIDRAKCRKAYLEIPNEVMKNKHAKLILHKFFNLCFISGLNPSDWNYSDIKPIPKPEKDPRDPLQNRCITLMCCVAKIYSSILNSRLQSYLENNKILVNEQNGFRASRSCIDHIFVLVSVLRNRKQLGKDTFLTFIDYKKAFDSVDRNLLLYKLAKIGINGRMYFAISSLYSNPRSRVILNEYETEYFDCPIGVKQGDNLSPTLFAIFINDLASEIKESNIGIDLNIEGGPNIDYVFSILLYADDIVCLAENEEDLQSILFIIENWCKKWRLEVNLTKTNIMHVRNSRKQQSKFTFLLDMKPVPYCTFYKYLGVNINEHLDFQFTVEKHAEAAGRALGAIVTKMIKKWRFSV